MLATNLMRNWPTAAEARILAALTKNGAHQRLQASEIGELLDTEATTANNRMRDLEKKGLAKAFPRGDRPRANVWAITPLGYRIAELALRLQEDG